ncbi:emerin (Emery-Dreifuss muscular dystrophy) isoform X1 [Cottoperca gobio]|uniref:Emerin (Emery-Dreifuss muscular dystrophy) isoform X1 n=1 Tax=Cottoperca gobio TaxID=56716 RepID=A0A6J2Q2M1_COTGO|nr:emerin isoform X1 [Cottoperca gobio]
MSLSEKSDEELSKLLSQYGIKHGPIVDSTRKLYEKKLEKAMEDAPVEESSPDKTYYKEEDSTLYEKKLEKAMEDAPVEEPSPDKTYYREEAEEITYITYHTPVRQDMHSDMLKRRNNVEPEEDEESDQDTEPPVTYRTANHSSAARSRDLERKSGGSMWKVIRLLLLLAVSAAVIYYAYCRVINNEENPFANPFVIQ